MDKTDPRFEIAGDKSQHELYVEGLMLGKSRTQAALDAGFSERDGCKRIHRRQHYIGVVVDVLAEAGLSVAQLVEKTDEGLDAMRVLTLAGARAKIEKIGDFDAHLRYLQR